MAQTPKAPPPKAAPARPAERPESAEKEDMRRDDDDNQRGQRRNDESARQQREQEQGMYNPNIPGTTESEKLWQDHVVATINSLYPHARNGIDFAWGRTDPNDDPKMLHWDDKVLGPLDMGKVEEGAKKLAEQDPYGGANYNPKKPLAGAGEYAPGEVTGEAKPKDKNG